MYIVYTEYHDRDARTVKRFYYTTCDDRNEANELAMMLENEYPWYHCVCRLEEAFELGVQNLPV